LSNVHSTGQRDREKNGKKTGENNLVKNLYFLKFHMFWNEGKEGWSEFRFSCLCPGEISKKRKKKG